MQMKNANTKKSRCHNQKERRKKVSLTSEKIYIKKCKLLYTNKKTPAYLLERTPLPRPQALEPDRSVGYARDGPDIVTDALKHAADLPVLSLSDDDVHSRHHRSTVIVNNLHDARPSPTPARHQQDTSKTERGGEGGRGDGLLTITHVHSTIIVTDRYPRTRPKQRRTEPRAEISLTQVGLHKHGYRPATIPHVGITHTLGETKGGKGEGSL